MGLLGRFCQHLQLPFKMPRRFPRPSHMAFMGAVGGCEGLITVEVVFGPEVLGWGLVVGDLRASLIRDHEPWRWLVTWPAAWLRQVP